MTNLESALQELGPRLRRALARRGARLEMDVAVDADVETHLLGPLATLMLSLARHARPGDAFRIRAQDRAGGDAELRVEGVTLPDDFPRSSPEADLWAVAQGFLCRFHRARFGHDEDRLVLLLPARHRAQGLRERIQP